MKKIRTVLSVLSGSFLMASPLVAQEVGEYGYLQLPVSAHAAALGGTSISVVEPEAALAEQNAALLCPEMEGQISLSYMNYVSDVNLMYGSYTGSFLVDGGWQVGVRCLSYGDFEGYDADGNATGTFGARDVALSYGVGYPINDRWRIGAFARALYSKYESNTAFALGVDVGLNYYNEASGRSISMVLTNLGGQLSSLSSSRRCSLPTQLSIGITKEVEHLPFCFSLTAEQLFDWKHSYVDASGALHKYSGGEQLLNHLLLGVEWLAVDNFYLAAAYSYRRQREFSGDGGFLRGLSLGAGLTWRQFGCQISYASYNAIDGSLLVGVSYKWK